MPVTKEQVELAEKLPARHAAAKAKAVELKKLKDDHEKAIKTFNQRLAAKRKELHLAQADERDAGAAATAIRNEVSRDLLLALNEAEVQARAVGERVKEAKANKVFADEDLASLKGKDVEPSFLAEKRRGVDNAALALAECEKDAAHWAVKVEKAKGEVKAAEDAVKKAALAPKAAAKPVT